MSFFKKKLTVSESISVLQSIDFQIFKNAKEPLHDLIKLHEENYTQNTKFTCEWELYYFICSCIYYMAKVDLNFTNTNELMNNYIIESKKVLYSERTKKDGDYACSQFELRMQAYRLAWINKDMNSLTGITTIFDMLIYLFIKQKNLNAGDDFLIDYIHDQRMIEQDYYRMIHKMSGLITGPMCVYIISSISKALNAFRKEIHLK